MATAVNTGVAYLSGGPCNGKTISLTTTQYNSGVVVCNGWTYQYSLVAGLHNGDAIYVAVSPTPPPGGAVSAAHLHSGWRDLRHSFNHTMPAAVRDVKSALTAGLHTVRRARKVRLR